MSNFRAMTKAKDSLKYPMHRDWKPANWIDNYFGHHVYGIQFDGGQVYKDNDDFVYSPDMAIPETDTEGIDLPTEGSTPPQGDLEAQGSRPQSSKGDKPKKDTVVNYKPDLSVFEESSKADTPSESEIDAILLTYTFSPTIIKYLTAENKSEILERESFKEAKAALSRLIEAEVRRARIDELKNLPKSKWDDHKFCVGWDTIDDRISELEAGSGEAKHGDSNTHSEIAS